MTGERNYAQNSITVIKRKYFNQILKNTPAVSKQAVSHGHPRVKPNLRVYNKLGLLCKKQSGLTVSDGQLLVGGKWENVEFYSLPLQSSHSHSNFHTHQTSLVIPILMEISWDPRDPWEFPIYTHL